MTPLIPQSSPQSPQRVALITGITGQDGAYLAEFDGERQADVAKANDGDADVWWDAHEDCVLSSVISWRVS